MTDKPELNDQELIAGCVGGDRQMQAHFVRRYADDVYVAVQCTLKSRTAAFSRQEVEDLQNTVFLQLLERNCRKIGQFKGKNGCSLKSWVKIIATRIAVDHLRSRGTDALAHQHTSEISDVMANVCADGSNPLAHVESAEQNHILQRCLETLKPAETLVIKLHFYRGLTIREAAGLMRITESNAYVIKHRAVQRLREKLEKLEKRRRSDQKIVKKSRAAPSME